MTSEQETKKGYGYMQWLIFLHFPILFSLGVVGACMKVIMAESIGSKNAQWMFCSALAVILLSIVGLAGIMQEEEEDRSYIRPVSRLLVLTVLLILVVPLFGYWLNSLAFLSVISAILIVPVFIGVRSWVKYKFG